MEENFTEKSINIITWNVNGINNLNKLDNIQWKKFYDCDVIGLNETWITSESPTVNLLQKKFHVFCSEATKEKSRGRPSGGILCLVNKNINAKKINLIEKTNLYIVLEIILKRIKLAVCCIYMSLYVDDNACNNILNETLTDLTKFNDAFIIIPYYQGSSPRVRNEFDFLSLSPELVIEGISKRVPLDKKSSSRRWLRHPLELVRSSISYRGEFHFLSK
jgi:hypothetical protein